MNAVNTQARLLNHSKDAPFLSGHSFMNSVSPSKKQNTLNTGGKGEGNTEKIQVTVPNPLLMPTSAVQMQIQQEVVRNVIQRVDDIFHLK